MDPLKPHVYTILVLFSFPSLFCTAKENTVNINGHSPFVFIENKGQVTDQDGQLRLDIDMKLDAGAVTIFLGDGQLHYQWVKTNSPGRQESEPVTTIFEATENQTTSIYRMDVTLLGANKNATLITEDKTDYYENYYLPCLPDGITVNTYRKIIYKDIYPNIDWVLYTNSKDVLKYDFIIHPGGNAKDIKIQYDGTTELALNNGVLIASTPYGSITESAPYTYILESKEEIIAQYQLKGNILSFDVATAESTIVIDPQLEWATYYGGGDNEVHSIYEREDGTLFVIGDIHNNAINIATTGAFQSTINGNRDCYLAHFNASGNRIWGTYFGGGGDDYAIDIYEKDSALYFCGHTESPNVIATNNGYISSHQGYQDGFIEKFNTSGQRIWGTYIGSTKRDYCSDIAIDLQGNIYVTGSTNSENMATSGSHLDTPGGIVFNAAPTGNVRDGFCMKFDSSMNLIWSTYYGGSNNDALGRIMIRGKYLYLSGFTESTNNIATQGIHQDSLGDLTGGYGGDGFVLKMDTSGTRDWCTYIGGNRVDGIHDMVFDDSCYLYLIGITKSSNNIATANTFKQSNPNNHLISYIIKLDTNGNRKWGSYYGGGTTYCISVVADPTGNTYLTGETSSSSDVATFGAYQPQKNNQEDYFIASFSPYGNIRWGTYYGGNHQEDARHGRNSNKERFRGAIYLGGSTRSSGMATQNAFQTSNASSPGYLAKFYVDTVVNIKYPVDSVFCPGDTFKLVYETNLPFYYGNTFTVQLSDSNGYFTNAVNIGTRVDSMSDTITCIIPTNTLSGNRYKFRVLADSPQRVSYNSTYNIRIKPTPVSFNATSNSPICHGDTLKLNGNSSSTNVSWQWYAPLFTFNKKDSTFLNADTSFSGNYILKAQLGSSGCSLNDTISILVKPNPIKPTANSNSPVCYNDTLHLSSGTNSVGVIYSWVGPDTFTSSSKDTIRSQVDSNFAGDYIIRVTFNGCSSSDTERVVILPKVTTPVAFANTPVCESQDIKLQAASINNAQYTWWSQGYTANMQNPIIVNSTKSDSGIYYVLATVNGCKSDTDSINIIINSAPTVNIYPNPSDTICSGNNATLVSITSNSTTPYYQWFVNSQLVGTGNIYTTTTLQDGDMIHCELTDSLRCKDPFTDTSNTIKMNVLPWLAPTVSITANPSRPIHPHEYVTFTANTANAGNNPAYQWLRNSIDIIGAQSSIWSANTLNDNDTVSVIITSSYKCPQPKTDTSNTVIIKLSSVNDNQLISTFTLYPNPNNGQFILRGNIEQNTQLQLVIYNSLGQVVHSDIATVNNGSLFKKLDLSLPSGIYIIKLSDGRLNATTSFTIH